MKDIHEVPNHSHSIMSAAGVWSLVPEVYTQWTGPEGRGREHTHNSTILFLKDIPRNFDQPRKSINIVQHHLDKARRWPHNSLPAWMEQIRLHTIDKGTTPECQAQLEHTATTRRLIGYFKVPLIIAWYGQLLDFCSGRIMLPGSSWPHPTRKMFTCMVSSGHAPFHFITSIPSSSVQYLKPPDHLAELWVLCFDKGI